MIPTTRSTPLTCGRFSEMFLQWKPRQLHQIQQVGFVVSGHFQRQTSNTDLIQNRDSGLHVLLPAQERDSQKGRTRFRVFTW